MASDPSNCGNDTAAPTFYFQSLYLKQLGHTLHGRRLSYSDRRSPCQQVGYLGMNGIGKPEGQFGLDERLNNDT